MTDHYKFFLQNLKLYCQSHPKIVENTLSNIFSMRIIGNKTHGDLAEVGISEFINRFMYNFSSTHIGKDAYRHKEIEEDITVTYKLDETRDFVSLKAYGIGPLQLSTDKSSALFEFLEQSIGNKIEDYAKIQELLNESVFSQIDDLNLFPIIYDEKKKECNIMVFDFKNAKKDVSKIIRIDIGKKYDYSLKALISQKGRKYPIYLFLNRNNDYICEVRYGKKDANALQRGLWTNTKTAKAYFEDITGWIKYSDNMELIKLIRIALNSSIEGHKIAISLLEQDIQRLITVW